MNSYGGGGGSGAAAGGEGGELAGLGQLSKVFGHAEKTSGGSFGASDLMGA